MDAEKLLRNLIKQEQSKDKKYILFMLLKFFELVKMVENKQDYLPLIAYQNGHFMLIYNDPEADGMEYIFTDNEEILIILQKLFYENKFIYFFCDAMEEEFSTEEILQKINEAIKNNDEETFRYYASKFKE
jgi:uncharacterized protein YpiB (UPF0302 family)